MRVLVTGASGSVGRFIVAALADAGHEVIAAGREAPAKSMPIARWRKFSLEPESIRQEIFEGCQALVHAAFHHVPEKYRGGEGDDPETFRRLNLEGSLQLFRTARQAGVARTIFLSSRAVYGPYPAGTILREDMTCRPDTLYGEIKLAAEAALREMTNASFTGTSLRATGVFGIPGQKNRKGLTTLEEIVADLLESPGADHKWRSLFEAYCGGQTVSPRIGTEIHGDDVGRAVCLLLEAPPSRVGGEIFNLSDLEVDRRELLSIVKNLAGAPHALPERLPSDRLNPMSTEKFREFEQDMQANRNVRCNK